VGIQSNLSPDRFDSHGLRQSPWGEVVKRVLEAALDAVDPEKAVIRTMQRDRDQLLLNGESYNLDNFKRILLVGAGKAGAPMAQACAEILGERLSGGVVIVKEGHAVTGTLTIPARVEILEAGHPLPDHRGVEGAGRIADLLSGTSAQDLIICVISGGGSALLVSPTPGVSLADLHALTNALLACGASINEINTLRKHLETLKGGGLARLASPAQLGTLILSDVVGDPLDVIASGPTVPDPSTYQDAFQVLTDYKIQEQVPRSVRTHLEKGQRAEIPETPKPGDPIFDNIQNVVIGNNMLAAQAALAQASSDGLNTMLLTTSLQGEARQAGGFLASIARQAAANGQPIPRPACIVAGGETTVTLSGDGLGGRNQELALGAVNDMAGLTDAMLVTLASDGGDGPSDAAGAVITGETLERALKLGLTPKDYLERNDSYHFFQLLDDLLKPGPTLTNVNDLNFIFLF